MRAELGSARAAIESPPFLKLVYLTLESWGMNSRGAALVPFEIFQGRWAAYVDDLVVLDSTRLDDLGSETDAIGKRLWRLIESLRITGTKSHLVAGTKALHHILPDLVPPMDRAYTAPFFGWAQRLQGRESEFFEVSFRAYSDMAERTNPSAYVGKSWNSSLTKVLDNAVVGYCKIHLLDRASFEKALVARAKEMGIYDQAMAEAEARVRSADGASGASNLDE